MIIDFLSRIFMHFTADQRQSKTRSQPTLSRLTPREKQIAFLWIHSNKQISRQLYITPETVRCHWKNIYAKLGVHSKSAVGELVGEPVGEPVEPVEPIESDLKGK